MLINTSVESWCVFFGGNNHKAWHIRWQVIRAHIQDLFILIYWKCLNFDAPRILQARRTLHEKCPYLEFTWSLFSPNAGKCRPEKLQIRTLFTQCQEDGYLGSCQTSITEIFAKIVKGFVKISILDLLPSAKHAKYNRNSSFSYMLLLCRNRLLVKMDRCKMQLKQ